MENRALNKSSTPSVPVVLTYQKTSGGASKSPAEDGTVPEGVRGPRAVTEVSDITVTS